MKGILQIIIAAGCSLSVLIAWPHHSHGNYQMTEYTRLTGTVTELFWINPHTWVYIDVANDDGTSSVWALEAAASITLARLGLSQNTIAIGETVSVRCHRLRDGSDGCLLGFLTPEGGEEKKWD